ncbi:MAG: translocation/assembly module TamB [Bacteroidales bacterium]|nr:translocation/assembly module TamB [Bacteroidales bacterium]
MVALAIPVGFYAALKDPFIQTFAARSAASYLSKKLNTTIYVGGFFVDLDLSLKVEQLVVYDRHDSVMFKAEKIKLRPSPNIFRELAFSNLTFDELQVQVIRYEDEPDLNLQFVIDYFSDSSDATTEASRAPAEKVKPPLIKIGSVKIKQSKFRYWDQHYDVPGGVGMDYAHLNISDINIDLSDVSIVGDSVNCDIRRLSGTDTCGIELRQLTAGVTLSSTGLQMRTLEMQTNESELHCDLKFEYPNYSAYLEFIDSVKMTIQAEPSTVMMSDIGYFAQELIPMQDRIDFTGFVSGPVSDLVARNFHFSYGKSTVFDGNLSLKGLPDVYKTYADVQINNLETNVDDLLSFKMPLDGSQLPLPDQLKALRTIHIDGQYTGFYNDFLANVNINTGVGNVFADLLVRKNDLGRIFYNGQLRARNFDLSALFETEYAPDKLNLDLRLDGQGIKAETISAKLDGKISSMIFLGNAFRDIRMSGDFSNMKFNGKLGIEDRKLRLDFSGLADFSEKNPEFNFDVKIPFANLYRLNLLKNDSVMVLSTFINANFSGSNLDEMQGQIMIDNTRYTDSRGSYIMQHFELNSSRDVYFPRRVQINSDFFDFEMAGTIDYRHMGESIRQFIGQYVNFTMLKPASDEFASQDFFIALKFKNTTVLRRLFIPELMLSPDASFSGVFTNRNYSLNTTFSASLLGYNNIKMNDVVLKTTTDRWNAGISLNGSEIIFRDSTADNPTALGLNKPVFSSSMSNDSIAFQLGWDDEPLVSRNRGDIRGYFNTGKEYGGELKITHADLIVNDSIWSISPGNKVEITRDYTSIEDLKLSLGNQDITLNGRLPVDTSDSLDVDLNQWDLSNFDLLTVGFGVDLDGVISGNMQLANLANSPAFFSNLFLTKLKMNGEKLGDARIVSSWSNKDQSIYLNAQFINVGNIATSRMLSLRGFYYPAKTKESLDFELALDNFRIKALAPFMKGILSRVEGLASGEFTIKGTPDKPELLGKLSLRRTGFLIDYLNVAYSLSHDFDISPTKIIIDKLELFDTLSNKAMVNGAITHDYLKNFRFDVRVTPRDFIAMNTDKSMNELFYGGARVNGEVLIKGPLNDIFMNIAATTRTGTSIYIPLSTTTSVGESDYIIFYSPNDSIKETEVVATKRQDTDKYNINLETVVTPDANLKIFLPYNMGNLESAGNGNLKIGYNSNGDFSLLGDYIVKTGMFNFVFENLVRKKFELLEGGRISWTGDPYDADIDIKGLYRVKTSVSSLGFVIDSTSSMRNRINVDCIIHLTQQLFNPTIKFSIVLPNADEDIRQMVFSTLDTTNDAMMTQQMISLLVLGSFSYSSGDNVGIGSSSINVISNQLSSWLSKISKDFDVGLHYKPGDKISNEELEVALSTQLFNDRITIDGNFGVMGNRVPTQNASNIVGDIDVNFLITSDGRLRLKAFNHSNVNSWYNSNSFENIAPYTQGVGISYKQEFDTFESLFKRKKNSKKTKKSP